MAKGQFPSRILLLCIFHEEPRAPNSGAKANFSAQQTQLRLGYPSGGLSATPPASSPQLEGAWGELNHFHLPQLSLSGRQSLTLAGQLDTPLTLTVWGLLIPSTLDPGPTWACFSPSSFSARGWFWHQLSPNGKQPSTAPPKRLKIRDTPTGKEEKNLTGSQVGKPLLAML